MDERGMNGQEFFLGLVRHGGGKGQEINEKRRIEREKIIMHDKNVQMQGI